MDWNDSFTSLFHRVAELHINRCFDYESGYTQEELSFLNSIGYQKREFFDFVEDYVAEGQPSKSTSLLIASVRRDFFLSQQKGKWSSKVTTKNDLPSFGEELDGIPYLPRILVKARAKLKGELDPDIMYGCGGDRNFLMKRGGIHLADFLRQVWSAAEDDAQIAQWIRTR